MLNNIKELTKKIATQSDVVNKPIENAEYFNEPIRKIMPALDMNFYASVSEKEAQPITDWSENLDSEVNRKHNDIFSFTLNYLNRPDSKPAHKYFTLDGNTFLNNSIGENAIYAADFPKITPKRSASPYLLNSNSDFIFPIWSVAKSAAAATGDQRNKFPFVNMPTYALSFGEDSRKTNKIFLIGEEMLKQYPVDFSVVLKLKNNSDTAHFNAMADDVDGYDEIRINENEIIETTNESGTTATINIKDNRFIKGLILLPKTYDIESIKVIIESWSTQNTQAKIMYLSTDLKISFTGNDISEIIVLEEKTGSVEELSFGITSNSCSVKISNNNERFIKYRDLLRANRVLQPSVSCIKQNGESVTAAKANLGTFYSDSWEISSESNFISCKAYDILYCLQAMPLYYPIPKITQAGVTVAATTAKAVFEQIFSLINAERQRNGIFGSDIKAIIDPSLNEVKMNQVLLGADTAWNMLQQMANFTMSNVFVNREGIVVVEVDKCIANAAAILNPVEINSSNSFSYTLPAMAKTLVNKVSVPYVTFRKVNDAIMMLSIEKEKFIVSRDNFGIPEKIIVHVAFDSFLRSYADLKIFEGDMTGVDVTTTVVPKIAYNGMGFEIDYKDTLKKFTIQLTTVEEMFAIEEALSVQENFLSQAKNGIKAFECDCGYLSCSNNIASGIAEKIIAAYSNGKEYILATWTGAPNLFLGDKFKSTPPKESAIRKFECLSNEFTLTSGLRQTTKARKAA